MSFVLFLSFLIQSPPSPEATPLAPDPQAGSVQAPVEHPQESEARAIAAALETFLADKSQRMKTKASASGRVRVHGDARSVGQLSNVLNAVDKVLGECDVLLGPFHPAPDATFLRADRPMELVLFAKADGYLALIDLLAAAEPRLKPYLESRRSGTGFTLYPARLAVYFHDPKVQAEARIDHSVAHNAAHLEWYRRYGFTPLWLAEGVATALEEQALGAVYANWYRDGFVYARSHGDWRGKATERALSSISLAELVRYPARPYQDELAHAAYGFAAWALEAEASAMIRFGQAIQERYDRHPEQGGQYQLPPEEQEQLLQQSFGADLLERLRSYWHKPPNAKRPKAPIPLLPAEAQAKAPVTSG